MITRSVHRCGLAGVWVVGLALGALALRGVRPPIAVGGAVLIATVLALGAAASFRESGTLHATAFWMLLIGYSGGVLAATWELAAGRSITGQPVECVVYWGLVGACASAVLTLSIGPLVGALSEEGSKPALESRARAVAITAGWVALILGTLCAWRDPAALGATCVALCVMFANVLSIARRRRWLARVRAGTVAGWAVRPARDDEGELLPLSPIAADRADAVLARVHVGLGGPYRARDRSVAIARVRSDRSARSGGTAREREARTEGPSGASRSI